MGMFDYVRSEIPLPNGFTGDLQTKDFDCIMTTILIRADGRLVKEENLSYASCPPRNLYQHRLTLAHHPL